MPRAPSRATCASAQGSGALLFQVQRSDVLGDSRQVRNHLTDGPAGACRHRQFRDAIASANQRVDTFVDYPVRGHRLTDRQ